MPPHCDSMDGPVVKAAKQALQTGNVDLVLPFVPKHSEDEVRTAFDRVINAGRNAASVEVASLYFFETVVRIHRAGENAPYTGLKPAGLSEGPAIPLAEEALESGSASAILGFLTNTLRTELEGRLAIARRLEAHRDESVDAARDYVEAMLGFEVYSHKLYETMLAPAHARHGSPAGESAHHA